ncbi:MAG: hypothetical protein M3118_00695 [Actinomycetota bacterium]|nr:hypothetical protein [Actinomycetota bacterium]
MNGNRSASNLVLIGIEYKAAPGGAVGEAGLVIFEGSVLSGAGCSAGRKEERYSTGTLSRGRNWTPGTIPRPDFYERRR